MLELGTQYTYYLFTLVGKMINSTFEEKNLPPLST